MRYQKEQQELLINEFINTLLIQRNLSPNTLYAYKNDLLGMSNWFRIRKYSSSISKTKLNCPPDPSAENTSPFNSIANISKIL